MNYFNVKSENTSVKTLLTMLVLVQIPEPRKIINLIKLREGDRKLLPELKIPVHLMIWE